MKGRKMTIEQIIAEINELTLRLQDELLPEIDPYAENDDQILEYEIQIKLACSHLREACEIAYEREANE
jgi:hypothetical protein